MTEIKNLAQMKKAINNGLGFVIVEHYIKPELTGQRRKPNVVQTNGFYSIVPGEPGNFVSKANEGKGFWFSYGKAKDWIFSEDGTCKYSPNGKLIWKIRFE